MASGGYRKPARPAAVSGPGALSRRTDGGPGDRQPIRTPSGGAYGERKAIEAQQGAAPMASGGPVAPPTGRGVAPQPGAAVSPSVGAFGPTQMSAPPASVAAIQSSRQMAADNPELLLRALYSQFPTPAIAALLRRTGANG